MTAKCRDGHDSTELDYCSVCGAAMPLPGAPRGAAGAAGPPAKTGPRASPPASANATTCPECGEPRPEPDARFCEVCRYDFIAGVPGPPPVGRASAPAPPPVSAPAPSAVAPPSANVVATPAPVVATGAKWELVLTVDPTLDDEPDPASPPPADPERIFPVEIAEMLVGRRDDRQNIRPAVPLNDPGASRRHAKFLLQSDGTVVFHDLASMNGTKLNGADVVSGSQHKLAAGDCVTLGRWSKITLRARG